jgi:hypothetical protein
MKYPKKNDTLFFGLLNASIELVLDINIASLEMESNYTVRLLGLSHEGMFCRKLSMVDYYAPYCEYVVFGGS